MSVHPHRLLFSVLASVWCVCVGLQAAELPLHERIDREIAAAHSEPGAPAGALSNDAEFLRRIFLDLTGRIPTAAEARRFLNDPSETKRERLIDQLIGGKELNRRLQQFFDEMLMERRGDNHVSSDAWRQFLYDKCASNVPYNQLASEILAADGVEGEKRPAVKFYLDRGSELHGITRDVGRVFFGMDIECAQRHDHPNITGYKQADYYGIHAFLVRSFQFAAKDKKPVFAEKAEGEATFKSVFEKTGEPTTALPELPSGAALQEPTFEKGKEYEVAPAKNVRPVPKFSRRSELVRLATSGNKQFDRNVANRLWALVMGRGIAFAPSRGLVLTGGFDERLIWWEAEATEPKPKRVIETSHGWVRAVAVSPDDQLVATAGNDGTVKLWSVESGEFVRTFVGHESHVYNVVFHPSSRGDQQVLASCDLKGVVRHWELGNPKSVRTLDASPLYKYDSGFRADIGGARCMAFSPNGTQLACGGITLVTNAFAGVGQPCVVRLGWESGKILQTHKPGQPLNCVVWGVVFHPEGFLISAAGGGHGGFLFFWTPDQVEEAFKYKLPARALDLDLHPDQMRLATVYDDNQMRIAKLVRHGRQVNL